MWLTIGTIVLAIIFILNATIYVIRQWRLLERGKWGLSVGRKQITGIGAVLYMLVICALLAGVIIPVVAPNSTFTNWINTGYSILVYYVGCIVIFSTFEIILALCGLPAWKKEEDL